jgi:transposase
MATATTIATFSDWLAGADVRENRLSVEQVGILQAAHRFRLAAGTDYYSTRLLGHFLLHAGIGLKVAQIARLLGISRPTASRQQNLSSQQAIRQAHHRMDGRPYGKLLPRYAGAIAHFLHDNPNSSRPELIAFVQRTFGVRVSRTSLYKFLLKFGLDPIATSAAPDAQTVAVPQTREQPDPPTPICAVVPIEPAAPPFSSHARSTPVPSC